MSGSNGKTECDGTSPSPLAPRDSLQPCTLAAVAPGAAGRERSSGRGPPAAPKQRRQPRRPACCFRVKSPPWAE